MSQFAAIAVLLGILPSSVVAFGPVPDCTAGLADWSFNSLQQSPCTIASALGEACTGVDFPIPPLNSSENYLGPIATAANTCRCSSVFYSVLSACAFCQGALITTWSFYDQNCSAVSISVFQPGIPSGFPVPHYAYQDPTANGANIFNPQLAQADTGPESTAIPAATGATSTASTTGITTTPTSQKSKKSNAGAIAGGVVGGIVVLAIIVGTTAWSLIRRRRQQESPAAPFDEKLMVADYTPNAPTLSNTPAPKLYDPNDPSTFPGNNGSFAPSVYSSVPSPPATSGYFPSNAGGHVQPASTHHTGYTAGGQPLSTHTTGQAGYTGMAEVM